MAEIGYIRVSSVDQNSDRQLDGVNLDKVFEDKCSGKTTDRPQLQSLMDYVREGDAVHVHDISRMARNLEDLIGIVKQLTRRGISISFHKESLTFSGEANPMQELMLSMLGAVYQFERAMLLERQREGIKKAKEAGKYKGRPPRVDRRRILSLLDSGLSIRKTAKEAGVATSTVQRIKTKATS